MGYKIQVAYAAARLAKTLHNGQVDKAGKDYFEGHLSAVGHSGSCWKEKVVGFLHDAAEDTTHSVEEVIGMLKKMMDDWEKETDGHRWMQEFEAVVGSSPNEVYHKLTEAEWGEIEEALHLMNLHTASSREAYIERFRGHKLAIRVKLNDLRNNMDLSRIPHPSKKDFERVERYKREYAIFTQMLQ
ncbi:MAG: phosphohydrolase [Porphyromonadaceae bacterium]|nr:phosphohydrolase [Porphyromonadaceae bacterium]